MRMIVAGARIQFLELIRLPAFIIPLVVAPAVAYIAIGLPVSSSRLVVMLGYVAFSMLGSMMFQFGVGIAATRNSPWTQYTLTIPGSGLHRAAALLIVGAAFALLFSVPIVVIGVVAGVPAPAAGTSGLIAAVLLGGAVVHGFLGIALGYWLPPRGATAIATVLYFPLSYVGGMFGPISNPVVVAVQPWLPTGAWTQGIADATLGRIDLRDALVLAGFGVLFAVVAVVGYRRVERTTYR